MLWIFYYYNPEVFYWIQIRRQPKNTELIVMFIKPIWDDFCFVTWYIIILNVVIRRH